MILIANIGNRNFTYQGDFIFKHIEHNNISFREFTKGLVIGDQEDHIELKIIDGIIRQYENALTKIILICTNQKGGHSREQDTYYAGELMKRKIKATLGLTHIEVEIQELMISIERTAEVMNWYKRLISQIFHQNKDAKYIICDAGGAPQMKTALKIMAEFIFPRDRFDVKYVVQQTGEVIDVEQIEYRKVLVAYQIESLIQQLNYDGALQLWSGITGLPEQKDKILLLLKFGEYRSKLLFYEAQKIARRLGQLFSSDDIALEEYAKGEPNSGSFENIKLAYLFNAQELLSLCQYHEARKSLNDMVLRARQFEELMLASIIEGYLKIQLISDYHSGKSDFIRYCAKNKISFEGDIINDTSIPALIAVAKTIENKDVQELIKSFEQIDQRGDKSLGTLRNNLVHKGKSVTEKKLSEFCPQLRSTIKRWIKLVGLPPINPYDRLNEKIAQTLRSK